MRMEASGVCGGSGGMKRDGDGGGMVIVKG